MHKLLIQAFVLLIVLFALGKGAEVLVKNADNGGRVASQSPLDMRKESATYLDPRRLTVAPDRFNGQNIFLHGRAVEVKSFEAHTWIWLDASVKDRDSDYLLVNLMTENLEILSDEWYCVYGTPAGPMGQDRAFSLGMGLAEYPVVQAYAIEGIAPEDVFVISVCDPKSPWYQG